MVLHPRDRRAGRSLAVVFFVMVALWVVGVLVLFV